MTRFPYDQFAKDYLKELLQPLGQVETSRKVPAQIREIDVYFVPPPQSTKNTKNTIELGLLGKFAAEPALVEPFRNAPTIAEIRSCMNKLFDIFAEVKRQAKGDKIGLQNQNYHVCGFCHPQLLNLYWMVLELT